MHTESLQWTEDTNSPLIEHLRFNDPAANTIVLGTGHFKAGQIMPLEGFSQYPLREISFVLEGELETESCGKTARIKAGDFITIPPDKRQRTTFLKDTKLVYIFFGHRGEPKCDCDC